MIGTYCPLICLYFLGNSLRVSSFRSLHLSALWLLIEGFVYVIHFDVLIINLYSFFFI